MKRILSVILTICMMAAFVPAVSAADTAQPNFTIKYDVGGIMTKYQMWPASWGDVLLHMADVKFNHTNGFFEYDYADPIVNNTLSSVEYTYGTKTISINKNGGYITFKINVPKTGDYKLRMDHDLALQGAYVDVIIDGTTVGAYNCYNSAASKNWFGLTGSNNHTKSIAKVVNAETNELGEDAIFHLDAGVRSITFKVKGTLPISASYRGSIGTFELISGDGNGNAIIGSINDDIQLNARQTEQLTATGYLSSTCEAIEKFTYSSSSDSVATVDENGLITAVGAGTATITASAGTVNALSTTVTVTDPTAYAVTYDIGGTMTKYGMQKQSWGASKLHMSNVKYLHTNGFFEYVAANPTVNGTSDNAEYQPGTKTLAMNKTDGYVTFKIDVPYEGDYKLWMDHDLAKEGAFVDVVIDETTVGTYNCYSASAANNWFGTNNASNHTQSIAKVMGEGGVLGEEATFHLTAGEHTISFRNKAGYPEATSKRGSVGTFKLIKGGSSNVLPMHGWATVSDSNGVPVTSLTNGDTATANAAVYTTDGVAAATATTITSSNPGVLAVDGTTVTAVGAGKATISATVEYEGVPYAITSNEILVTDPAITTNTVSFYATTHGADVALTINDGEYAQDTSYGEIPANTTVTLTAPTDIEGKTFRGWMRGSEDNGVWLTNANEISVTLVSNTFLTAVYDVAETENEATVEFWNWSGQYLGSKTVDKETKFGEVTEPDIHDLTGYEFAGWSVADNEIVSGLTRAVAQFTKSAGNYNVTIPENVGGAASGAYEFDTKVTLTSENPVYWQRDGKTVDYGAEYSFYVWDSTKISISDKGNSAPKVILDKHDDYGTYMIEFDKGEAANMRILEAGILFGNDPKVNSFDSKAVASGRDLTHGQFTAKANTTNGGASNAVGYIVYLDGGIARVLYAK